MAYTQSIVQEIRRKDSNGDFETPVKLGSEQRFVTALLNSHNNNLEEQSILGVDCITTEWTHNDIIYTTKKFFNGDLSAVSNKGYYILFKEDYSNTEVTADFYFTDDELCLPVYGTGSARFELDGDHYVLTGDDPDIYSIDEENGRLKVIPSYRIAYKETLYLRTDTSNTSDQVIISDVLISEKITAKKHGGDDKIYTRESITNYLGN